MKKIIFILSLVLTLIFNLNYITFAATNDIPTEVIKAANDGLILATNKICANPEKYGFDSGLDAKAITLGDGYNLYFVNKDKISSSYTNSLLDLCDLSNFWTFIVKSNGNPKSFLTIGYEDGKYRMVDFGGKSQVFGESLINYKRLANIDNLKVAKIQNTYYLVDKEKTSELILPSISKENSVQFNGMNNTKLIDSKEIIKTLKDNKVQDTNRGGSTLPLSKQTNNNNMLFIVGVSLLGMATLSIFCFRRKLKR